jgi:hypothetical protein
MSLESKFETFKTKHDLEDEAIAEILVIFNEAFVELAHKLLASTDIQIPKTVKESSKTYTGPKKWATKIAAEYAAENEVTLDDFDKEKVTKKDIDELVKAKNNTKMPALNTKPKKPAASSSNEVKTTPEVKEKCKGLTKSGEPCNRPGTEKPNGSKNCFCFRHAMDWKNYEVSSDSELDEEDIFTDPNKITIPDLAIRDPEEE